MADIQKVIEGLSFEWNIEKAIINKKKHGISFEEASLVFQDDSRIEMHDLKHSTDEERIMVIGMVRDIISLIYTERHENAIRLISARKATKKERDIYYEQFGEY